MIRWLKGLISLLYMFETPLINKSSYTKKSSNRVLRSHKRVNVIRSQFNSHISRGLLDMRLLGGSLTLIDLSHVTERSFSAEFLKGVHRGQSPSL